MDKKSRIKSTKISWSFKNRFNLTPENHPQIRRQSRKIPKNIKEEILKKLDKYNNYQLAKMYGVSHVTVRYIRNPEARLKHNEKQKEAYRKLKNT